MELLLSKIFIDDVAWNILIGSLSLVGIVLGYFFITLLMKIWSKRVNIPRWVNIAAFILLFAGIFGLVNTSAFRFASGFQYFKSSTEYVTLPLSDTFTIDLLQTPDWYQPAILPEVYVNNAQTEVGYGEIDFRVIRSSTYTQPTLKISTEVSARTPELANERLESFQYELQADSTGLYISPFYLFKSGELRAMDVDFRLYIPENAHFNTTSELKEHVSIWQY